MDGIGKNKKRPRKRKKKPKKSKKQIRKKIEEYLANAVKDKIILKI